MSTRQIKFRVWNETKKEWEKSLNYALRTNFLDAAKQLLVGNCYGSWNHVNKDLLYPQNYIIQQFTGLFDKNGKEIFEGDLVNFFIPGWPHEKYPENVTNARVHWSDEDGAWFFGKFGAEGIGQWDGYSIVCDMIDTDSFEVVGNIFENPELENKQ